MTTDFSTVVVTATKAEQYREIGADDEIRTRDPHLGKVMLYQLSYFRIF
ncbi:MAG: hypothetical protein RLZZ526_1041 [Actinomycetota bacterium]